MSWAFKLTILVGIGVLGLVLLIGLLSLLENPRTRTFLVVLLALPVLIFGSLAATAWFVRFRTATDREQATLYEEAREAMLRTHTDATQPGTGELTVILPSEGASSATQGKGSIALRLRADVPGGAGAEMTLKASRMLHAVGKAMIEAVRDYGADRAEEIQNRPVEVISSVAKASFPSLRAKGPAPPKAVESPKTAVAGKSAAVTETAESTKTASPGSARPAWVDRGQRVEDGVYQVAVESDPRQTAWESDRALAKKIEEAVDEFAAVYLGEEAASEVRLPQDYVDAKVVQERWSEKRNTSVGQMIVLHALLKFDREVKDRIDRVRREALAARRLWYTGGGLGGVLLLLSVVYGYLKIDLATRGAHRRRLRVAAAAIILGAIAAGAALLTS